MKISYPCKVTILYFVIEFSIVDSTAVKAAAQCEEDTLFIADFRSGLQ